MTHDASKLYGKCPTCGHVFLVAQLPMRFDLAAQAMRSACCPMCGTKKGIVVARAEEIENA